MRLTLRTLLAYLDDTLEPHEIKEIGQKVAESDAAQELVARIKQVTRRRRLTTPPPGGPGAKFDANTIAEYLDNELSSELVAELEKTCLESDVHLAEVASCHQILTLVLGEPALVPPTARERMYGLVKGREAIPFRKARARDGAAAAEGGGGERVGDDPLLPGLPSSRGWLLWALPLAALLVLAALAVAIWQALPGQATPAVVANDKTNPPPVTPPRDDGPPPPVPTPAKQTWTGKATKVEGDKLTLSGADGKETTVTVPASAKVTLDGKDAKLPDVGADSTVTVTQDGDAFVVDAVSPEKTWTGRVTKVEGGKLTLVGTDGKETPVTVPASAKVTLDGKDAKLEEIVPDSPVTVTVVGDAVVAVDALTNRRAKPPSNVRASAGLYAAPAPGEWPPVLVQRQAQPQPPDQPAWKYLVAGKSEVFTSDDLVSLPGYNSQLDLASGARVVLHGHVPEFTPPSPDPRVNFFLMDFLVESAVRLNQPEAGFDLDLTLERGRIYLSNAKKEGPVKVRLRFAGEVWDLTLLGPDAEVGVDLLQYYTGRINWSGGEAPFQELYLNLLSGRADVEIDYREYGNLPAPAVIHWDNKVGGASEPQPIPPQGKRFVDILWSKTPQAGATEPDKAAIQQMRAALQSLSELMEKKSVDAALLEARGRDGEGMLRRLAVYSFGAIDDVDKVLDVLCTDAAEAHAEDRHAAVFALRRWIARDPNNGARLYDPKKQAGLLMKHFVRTGDAETTLDLLHDFPDADAHKPATFEFLLGRLHNRELAIRELAYWHLLNQSAGVGVPPPTGDYNAAWGADQCEKVEAAWRALLEKHGDLPMPPPPK